MKLIEAAQDGMEEELRKILEENKKIDVNWSGENGWTPLHYSCQHGDDKIVTLLLVHPHINVNQQSSAGSTSFLIACMNGKRGCVRLLLKDAKVKVNEPTNRGYTPLWLAPAGGHVEVITWWIASGREIDLGQLGNKYTDAIAVAGEYGKTEWFPCWRDSGMIPKRPSMR